MLIIGAVSVGIPLYKKYSYGTETANLNEYFGAEGEMAAIILRNEKISDKALILSETAWLESMTRLVFFSSLLLL